MTPQRAGNSHQASAQQTSAPGIAWEISQPPGQPPSRPSKKAMPNKKASGPALHSAEGREQPPGRRPATKRRKGLESPGRPGRGFSGGHCLQMFLQALFQTAPAAGPGALKLRFLGFFLVFPHFSAIFSDFLRFFWILGFSRVLDLPTSCNRGAR